jgi:hypothetical protein
LLDRSWRMLEIVCHCLTRYTGSILRKEKVGSRQMLLYSYDVVEKKGLLKIAT